MAASANADAKRWVLRLRSVYESVFAVFNYTSGNVKAFRNPGHGSRIPEKGFEESVVALMLDDACWCDPLMSRLIVGSLSDPYPLNEFCFSVPTMGEPEVINIRRVTAYQVAVDAAVELITWLPRDCVGPLLSCREHLCRCAMFNDHSEISREVKARFQVMVEVVRGRLDNIADFLNSSIVWNVDRADELMLRVETEYIRTEQAILSSRAPVPPFQETNLNFWQPSLDTWTVDEFKMMDSKPWETHAKDFERQPFNPMSLLKRTVRDASREDTSELIMTALKAVIPSLTKEQLQSLQSELAEHRVAAETKRSHEQEEQDRKIITVLSSKGHEVEIEEVPDPDLSDANIVEVPLFASQILNQQDAWRGFIMIVAREAFPDLRADLCRSIEDLRRLQRSPKSAELTPLWSPAESEANARIRREFGIDFPYDPTNWRDAVNLRLHLGITAAERFDDDLADRIGRTLKIEMSHRRAGANATEFNSAMIIAPTGKEAEFDPNEDFTVVKWRDKNFTFTKNQAACVKELWKNHSVRRFSTSNELLNAADNNAVKVSAIFMINKKGTKQKESHPAWDTMIKFKGARYWLALREPENHPENHPKSMPMI